MQDDETDYVDVVRRRATTETQKTQPYDVRRTMTSKQDVKEASTEQIVPFDSVDGYGDLASILTRAYSQAAVGKGAERHAEDRPFWAQPINTIPAGMPPMAGLGGVSYQVQKKCGEAVRMADRGQIDAAIREMLGVINYSAAVVLQLERMQRRSE